MNAAANAEPPIGILLVDDHTLFREGLRRMLEMAPGIEVRGDFASAPEALAAIAAPNTLDFDVALIDYELSLPGSERTGGERTSSEHTTGVDLVRELRRLRPAARVLMVTAGMQPGEALRALNELNAGIFIKTEPLAELMLAIRRTAAGTRWLSSGAAVELISARATQPPPGPRQPLTPRESTVLNAVLEGLSNKQIGARMDLTESAVKAVLQKLFEKTGVRTRSQLVRYAIEAQITRR